MKIHVIAVLCDILSTIHEWIRKMVDQYSELHEKNPNMFKDAERLSVSVNLSHTLDQSYM